MHKQEFKRSTRYRLPLKELVQQNKKYFQDENVGYKKNNYYSTIRRNKLLICTTYALISNHYSKWEKLDPKATYYMVPSYDLREDKYYRSRKEINGCQWLQWGKGLTTMQDKSIIWIMELFYMLIVALIIQPYSFVKIQRTIHQKGKKLESYVNYAS